MCFYFGASRAFARVCPAVECGGYLSRLVVLHLGPSLGFFAPQTTALSVSELAVFCRTSLNVFAGSVPLHYRALICLARSGAANFGKARPGKSHGL